MTPTNRSVLITVTKKNTIKIEENTKNRNAAVRETRNSFCWIKPITVAKKTLNSHIMLMFFHVEQNKHPVMKKKKKQKGSIYITMYHHY